MTSAQALDAAFSGQPCDVVMADGSWVPLSAQRWSGEATPSDQALFVIPCTGRTLDVGCGPGRLAGALTHRGIDVLGVDISREAVRQTHRRGAAALCQDIFSELPSRQPWDHVLLADGNIGLGGLPGVLLRRAAELLGPEGTVLVELAGNTGLATHRGVQLRVRGQLSRHFDWATVGTAAIDEVAHAAGLLVSEVRYVAGRHVATLRRGSATMVRS